MPADVPVAVADPRPRSRLPARSICNSGYKIVCLQGSSTRIHLKMTRFFFLLAALPYFAGSAAAHPAILPDSSAVVRLDTAASGRTVYLRVDEPPRFQGGDVLAFRDWVFRHLCFGGEMFREGVGSRRRHCSDVHCRKGRDAVRNRRGAGTESGPDPGSRAGAHPVAQVGTRTARER